MGSLKMAYFVTLINAGATAATTKVIVTSIHKTVHTTASASGRIQECTVINVRMDTINTATLKLLLLAIS